MSTLLSIASLLHSYVFQRSESNGACEDQDYSVAMQCLILFWSSGPFVLPRSGLPFHLLLLLEMPGVLVRYVSFLEAPKRVPVALRSSFLTALRRSLQLFPDECVAPVLQAVRPLLQ